MSQEHYIREVVREPGAGPLGLGFRERHVPVGATVTGMLLLYGMPRTLCGSVLCHELTHAWFRLQGFPRLDLQSEEGTCQLMALLWTQAEAVKMDDAETARQAAYVGDQIMNDPSEVYGDGVRHALAVYRASGLEPLLSHLRQHGRLPPAPRESASFSRASLY